MEWKRHSKDSVTATEIAAWAGMRPEQVRSLVVAGDEYAVITWTNQPRRWEIWHRTPTALDERYWQAGKGCTSAASAKAYVVSVEAERLVLEEVRSMPEGTGLVVMAEWLPPYHGSAPMRFPCRSTVTAADIASIMKRLGCSVWTEIAA